jgi:hypothetical protein
MRSGPRAKCEMKAEATRPGGRHSMNFDRRFSASSLRSFSLPFRTPHCKRLAILSLQQYLKGFNTAKSDHFTNLNLNVYG